MADNYLDFCLMPRQKGKKTDTYEVRNKANNALLGQVKWYGQWRKYCFFISGEFVFDSNCLQEITSFINKKMLLRRAEKQS